MKRQKNIIGITAILIVTCIISGCFNNKYATTNDTIN